jgi:acyl-CoA dehydrogenase
VDTFPSNAKAVAAVAVPYLKLFGTVAGGWMMARAALLAAEKLRQPDADSGFLETKLATARFYAEHELPKAISLAREVTHGAESVLALDPDRF